MRLWKPIFVLLATVLLASCHAAQAQIPTYTSPQTVQQVLAPAGTACTTGNQTFTVTNLGQTQHYAYIKPSSGVQTLKVEIDGTDIAGNTYRISDQLGIPYVNQTSLITGSGYFPSVQVLVNCSGGTFTLNYSGASSTYNLNAGSYAQAQGQKILALNAPENAYVIPQPLQTPFGNSSGVLFFQYQTTAIAGSSLLVQCNSVAGGGGASSDASYTFTLANTLNVQSFVVPGGPCWSVTTQYTNGGAGAGFFIWEYDFNQPGATVPNFYTHITGTTATIVKSGPGVVHSVSVGTPAAGTISLFDLAPASCTGTPATSVVAVITATSTFPAAPQIYDTLFANGICVKASATMDFTVSSQ